MQNKGCRLQDAEGALSRALAYLAQTQNPDGGWGYSPGHTSYVEPTALVLLAFGGSGQDVLARGRRWLLAAQREDGAWGVDSRGYSPSWMTAWAVWALATCTGEIDCAQALAKGTTWLLAEPTLKVEEATVYAQARHLLGIDPALQGWPWQPGEAAWVFPTALTLLALVAAGIRQHPRLDQGLLYLLDRACPDGGWNFGNPAMFGKRLPALIPETAMALLALRTLGVKIEGASVQAGLAYLRSAPTAPTSLELALGSLALLAWEGAVISTASAIEALLRKQGADGGWENSPFITAAAALALGKWKEAGGWQMENGL